MITMLQCLAGLYNISAGFLPGLDNSCVYCYQPADYTCMCMQAFYWSRLVYQLGKVTLLVPS